MKKRLEFIKAYERHLKDKKHLELTEDNVKGSKMLKMDIMYTDRHIFTVCHEVICSGSVKIGGSPWGSGTITLDEEDLKYLYNKYSKRLQEELNENIENLKSEYGLED